MPQPDTTPTWVAAIGTVAAVVVALFGPGLRAWWTRPRLGLYVDDESLFGEELIFSTPEKPRTQVISLVVANHGRRQADDVEAILTVWDTIGPIRPDDEPESEIPAFEIQTLGRGALTFELSPPGRPTITIPPRAARTLHFVLLGNEAAVLDAIRERQDDVPEPGQEPPSVVGTFVLWPVAHADRITWINDDSPLDVAITLTSARTRATTWNASFKAWSWSGMKDEPADVSGIKFEWLEPLRRARRSGIPRTPLHDWVTRHTPWALVRGARDRREFERAMRDDAAT